MKRNRTGRDSCLGDDVRPAHYRRYMGVCYGCGPSDECRGQRRGGDWRQRAQSTDAQPCRTGRHRPSRTGRNRSHYLRSDYVCDVRDNVRSFGGRRRGFPLRSGDSPHRCERKEAPVIPRSFENRCIELHCILTFSNYSSPPSSCIAAKSSRSSSSGISGKSSASLSLPSCSMAELLAITAAWESL